MLILVLCDIKKVIKKLITFFFSHKKFIIKILYKSIPLEYWLTFKVKILEGL